MDSLRLVYRIKPAIHCLASGNTLLSRAHLFPRSSRLFADDTSITVAPVPRIPRLYLKKYHEPEYLEKLKPPVPYYDLYNIRVEGYDFAIIEQYVKLIQRLCRDAGVRLENYWPLPAKLIRLETYAVDSSFVESAEDVKIHQRIVQLKHLTTVQLSILLDAINQAKPPGVQVSFLEHTQGQEDEKYIVDLKLKSAEAELEELKKPISLLGKS